MRRRRVNGGGVRSRPRRLRTPPSSLVGLLTASLSGRISAFFVVLRLFDSTFWHRPSCSATSSVSFDNGGSSSSV
eukprot:6180157-Pleurochrysis_carterae.AAC.3